MLIIRKEQLEILSQVTKIVFEDRMTEHINKHFPTHYTELGEEDCRELIQYGINQSSTHGFTSEREVCKFIDLMICFGVEFDTDLEQIWATDILSDTTWINAKAKMDALFKTGLRHLENSSN